MPLEHPFHVASWASSRLSMAFITLCTWVLAIDSKKSWRRKRCSLPSTSHIYCIQNLGVYIYIYIYIINSCEWCNDSKTNVTLHEAGGKGMALPIHVWRIKRVQWCRVLQASNWIYVVCNPERAKPWWKVWDIIRISALSGSVCWSFQVTAFKRFKHNGTHTPLIKRHAHSRITFLPRPSIPPVLGQWAKAFSLTMACTFSDGRLSEPNSRHTLEIDSNRNTLPHRMEHGFSSAPLLNHSDVVKKPSSVTKLVLDLAMYCYSHVCFYQLLVPHSLWREACCCKLDDLVLIAIKRGAWTQPLHTQKNGSHFTLIWWWNNVWL